MNDNIDFSDGMTYQPPEASDCLVVPEVQWDCLYGNLQGNDSLIRDAALWALGGIAGGGAIALISGFFAIGSEGSVLVKVIFMVLGILLFLACPVLFWFANRFSPESTAKAVSSQMNVLKPGFRRLLSRQESKTEPNQFGLAHTSGTPGTWHSTTAGGDLSQSTMNGSGFSCSQDLLDL